MNPPEVGGLPDLEMPEANEERAEAGLRAEADEERPRQMRSANL